jgi:hypothetical protein
VLGGDFMPPTREMIIQTHTGTTPSSDPSDPTLPAFPVEFANGLGSGQYRLPNFDFIFPENHKLGDPIIPNNFQDMPFLAQGTGPLFGVSGNTVVGQLTPWPGNPAPPPVTCSTAGGFLPIVSAGIDFSVAPGLTESLAGTLKQDANATFPTITWAQTDASGFNAHLSPTSGSLTPTFTTVGAPLGTVLTFKLTVTDNFGTSTASVNVTIVNPPDTLTATAIWRTPIGNVHKVGVKGGQLRVTITESITDPTIRIFVIGWGEAMVSPILGLPTYIFRADGVPAPESVTIRSSLGAETTVPVTIR